MPRPPRIQFENAWYHVMNRGGAKRTTFENDIQRHTFLSYLGEVCAETGVQVHAYCLMTNHFHLLVCTPRANLAAAMQLLSSRYTQCFNHHLKTDGALFRGRYKAILIDADDYLVQVSRYIHRNPVEAQICPKAEDYQWSSYPAYIGAMPAQIWLHTSEILRRVFPAGSPDAYQQLVDNPLLPSLNTFYQSKRIAPVLGDKSFRRHVMSTLSVQHSSKRRLPTVSIDDILRCTAKHYCVDVENIRRKQQGKKNSLRNVAVYVARSCFEHSLDEIISSFAISRSSLSDAISLTRREIASNHALQSDIEQIKRQLL